MLPASTARPEIEQRLRLLQAIADTTPDFAYVFDPQGRFVFANRRLLAVWGMGLEAIVGKTCRELGYEQWHHDMHMREIAQVIATRQPIKGEVPFTAPLTGVFGVYEYIFTPVLGSDGEVELIAGTTRDVTDRKHAAEALRASEERFRSVMENMSEGLMLFDAEANLVYQNPASLRIHGFEPEHGGRLDREEVPLFWRAWDVEDREIAYDEWPVARVFRGERFQNQILRVVRSDNGREFHGSYNGSPIRDEQGRVALGFITIADITERQRAEQARRTGERRFRALAESGPQLVWTTDPEGRVDYMNERWCAFTGQSPEEALGEGWIHAVHPEDRARAAALWAAALAAGTPYEAQYRLLGRDGAPRWFLARGVPLRDPSGRISNWFGTNTDIDEQTRTVEALRRSEDALRLARDELSRVNTQLERTVDERTARLRDSVAELEHFSYTITHDMRAPLRAMQAFGQILQEDYQTRLDEPGRDYLRRIVAAAGRMDQLITDSLNYAKAVQTELTLEPVDTAALVRGIVDSYPQFQPPRTVIDIDADLPSVLANPAGLTQCVSNLLGNAVKFVAPGVTPRVRVRGEVLGPVVRLWFEDNGIGIPREQQERIFQMFQRLSRDYEGTGVGLALVRKVAGKMRGAVGLESTPGQGSRFWIELQKP